MKSNFLAELSVWLLLVIMVAIVSKTFRMCTPSKPEFEIETEMLSYPDTDREESDRQQQDSISFEWMDSEYLSEELQDEQRRLQDEGYTDEESEELAKESIR